MGCRVGGSFAGLCGVLGHSHSLPDFWLGFRFGIYFLAFCGILSHRLPGFGLGYRFGIYFLAFCGVLSHSLPGFWAGCRFGSSFAGHWPVAALYAVACRFFGWAAGSEAHLLAFCGFLSHSLPRLGSGCRFGGSFAGLLVLSHRLPDFRLLPVWRLVCWPLAAF